MGLSEASPGIGAQSRSAMPDEVDSSPIKQGRAKPELHDVQPGYPHPGFQSKCRWTRPSRRTGWSPRAAAVAIAPAIPNGNRRKPRMNKARIRHVPSTPQDMLLARCYSRVVLFFDTPIVFRNSDDAMDAAPSHSPDGAGASIASLYSHVYYVMQGSSHDGGICGFVSFRMWRNGHIHGINATGSNLYAGDILIDNAAVVNASLHVRRTPWRS